MEGSDGTTMPSGSMSVPASSGSFDSSADTSLEIGGDQTSFNEVEATTTEPVNADLVFDNQTFDEFVHSEKPAHDKLIELSELNDEDQIKDPEAAKSEKTNNEPTLDQKVILLQAEAIKFLADRDREKDNERLLKKLKELMEEMENNPKKASKGLFSAVLNLLLVLSKAGEKGTQYMEEETKPKN